MTTDTSNLAAQIEGLGDLHDEVSKSVQALESTTQELADASHAAADGLDDHERKIAELEAQLEALKREVNPPPPEPEGPTFVDPCGLTRERATGQVVVTTKETHADRMRAQRLRMDGLDAAAREYATRGLPQGVVRDFSGILRSESTGSMLTRDELADFGLGHGGAA